MVMSDWVPVETVDDADESSGLHLDIAVDENNDMQYAYSMTKLTGRSSERSQASGIGMVSGWIPVETGEESTDLHRDQWMRAVAVRTLDDEMDRRIEWEISQTWDMGVMSGWIPIETGDESTGLHRDQWMGAVTVLCLLDDEMGLADKQHSMIINCGQFSFHLYIIGTKRWFFSICRDMTKMNFQSK